jgi:hypothetical protein
MRVVSYGRERMLGLGLALLVAGAAAAQTVQKLPEGAGAIGKSPDAIVLPGYADVPRPPAFDEAKRREVLQSSRRSSTTPRRNPPSLGKHVH